MDCTMMYCTIIALSVRSTPANTEKRLHALIYGRTADDTRPRHNRLSSRKGILSFPDIQSSISGHHALPHLTAYADLAFSKNTG